jgi:hypothetical protein
LLLPAGQYLFCHFYSNSLIRQLSVTKDFNPGAQPLSYFSLTDELRTSVQYHLTQLNRNSVDPKHAVWAINTIYSLRGEHVFIAENLTAVPRPKSRGGQFSNFTGVYGVLLASVGYPKNALTALNLLPERYGIYVKTFVFLLDSV